MITTPTAGRNGAIWSDSSVQRWTGTVRLLPMTNSVRMNSSKREREREHRGRDDARLDDR